MIEEKYLLQLKCASGGPEHICAQVIRKCLQPLPTGFPAHLKCQSARLLCIRSKMSNSTRQFISLYFFPKEMTEHTGYERSAVSDVLLSLHLSWDIRLLGCAAGFSLSQSKRGKSFIYHNYGK